MRKNEIDKSRMAVRERERESKEVKNSCSYFDVKNKEKGNINNKTGYRKKREDERLVHGNISGLTDVLTNEKYRKSFFLFVNDREGNAFTKENLSFLNKKKCSQRKKDVKRRGLINMSLQKQKLTAERGITLLALIITVVILIILAAVTINITLNNGLINQAKQAGEDTMQAAKDEQQMLEDAASYINGILADTNKAKTLVQAFKDGEIQVGDYVDYAPDPHDPVTVGTDKTGFTDARGILGTTDQTYSQDTTNTHWRVLGLTEDGNSVMLLGSQIAKDGDDLKGEDTLNEICGLYHNSALAQETRSIKIEDINRALGGITVDYEQGTVTLNGDSSNTNIGETYGREYITGEGDYTPEGYLKDPKEEITPGTKIKGNAYRYEISSDYNRLDYEYLKEKGAKINERGYEMLFRGVEDYAKSYFLANKAIDTENQRYTIGVVNDILIKNGTPLFSIGGSTYEYYFAVRPVVVLRSNITVEQIHVIDDQMEEEWDTVSSGMPM